jgi:hypothetical protein
VQATVDKIKANPASLEVETRIWALDPCSQRIHVVVNSAGVMARPYRTTEGGVDSSLMTRLV